MMNNLEYLPSATNKDPTDLQLLNSISSASADFTEYGLLEDDCDDDNSDLEFDLGHVSSTNCNGAASTNRASLPPKRKAEKAKWSSEEDAKLTKAVELLNGKNWKLISTYLPGKSEVQCLHRWTKVLTPNLTKGPWTNEVRSAELLGFFLTLFSSSLLWGFLPVTYLASPLSLSFSGG
jgi:hypothetical protein